jgi:hypothetical protein
MRISAVAAAVLVAALTLAGCASAPAVPSSAPASPTPASPSPSPTPASAIVPFGGDCSAVASAAEVGRIVGAAMTAGSGVGIADIAPDQDASFALVGGLQCAWSGSEGRYAALELAPADQVPAEVVAARTGLACIDTVSCERAEVMGSTWVGATTARRDSGEGPLGEAERARIGAILDGLLAHVREARPDLLVARAATPSADRWTMPSCDALQEVVRRSSGMSTAVPGYPTDVVPSGAAWEIAVAQGVQQWCPWYSSSGGVAAVELDIQPGLGAPARGELTAASARPVEVEGADAAYALVVEPRGSGARVIVVSGANRLSVSGLSDAPVATLQRIAAAVLATLGR